MAPPGKRGEIGGFGAFSSFHKPLPQNPFPRGMGGRASCLTGFVTAVYDIEILYWSPILMPEATLELLKGTLDLLILQVLELRPMHGSAIAERIFQVTHGAFQVKAGSLFPGLHRLEQKGWVEGNWQETAEGKRVRSYMLTREGKKQLAIEKKTWMRIVEAMTALLESA